MFVTNWISTTKIQKYRRLPTFLGTISYPELRYTLNTVTVYSSGNVNDDGNACQDGVCND